MRPTDRPADRHRQVGRQAAASEKKDWPGARPDQATHAASASAAQRLHASARRPLQRLVPHASSPLAGRSDACGDAGGVQDRQGDETEDSSPLFPTSRISDRPEADACVCGPFHCSDPDRMPACTRFCHYGCRQHTSACAGTRGHAHDHVHMRVQSRAWGAVARVGRIRTGGAVARALVGRADEGQRRGRGGQRKNEGAHTQTTEYVHKNERAQRRETQRRRYS